MLFEAIAEEWARATHTEPTGVVAEARRLSMLGHESRVGVAQRDLVPLRKRGSLDTVVDIVPAP